MCDNRITPYSHITKETVTCIGESIKPLVSNDQVPGSYCNTMSPYLGFWAGKPESVRAETEGWMGLAAKHTHDMQIQACN